MLKNNLKFYIAIGLVISVIIFFYNAWKIESKGYEKFLAEEFGGIIIEISYREENRGLPDVKINDKWYLFYKWEMDIANKIQVGDSIVKKSNSSVVSLFRKDNSGTFVIVELE